jgi:hypothetical protein
MRWDAEREDIPRGLLEGSLGTWVVHTSKATSSVTINKNHAQQARRGSERDKREGLKGRGKEKGGRGGVGIGREGEGEIITRTASASSAHVGNVHVHDHAGEGAE